MNSVEKHAMFLISNWNSSEKMVSTELPDEDRKWYQFWKLDPERKKSIEMMVQYIIEGIDDFVVLTIKEMKAAGVQIFDKQKIIECVSALYDAVVTLPVWAKVLAKPIRDTVVKVIAPIFADFLYTKYQKADATALKTNN